MMNMKATLQRDQERQKLEELVNSDTSSGQEQAQNALKKFKYMNEKLPPTSIQFCQEDLERIYKIIDCIKKDNARFRNRVVTSSFAVKVAVALFEENDRIKEVIEMILTQDRRRSPGRS